MQPELSLIITVYNAASFIEDSLAKIIVWQAQCGFEVEVIIVNDGSSDNSEVIILDFIDNHQAFKLISYSKNKGKGYAVKQGILRARGAYKIFTDADIPYGINSIETVLEYLNQTDVDVCVGNRKDDASDYHLKSSFLRALSSKVFTFFISNVVISGLGDTQCGLKGFTEKAANQLFSKLHINGFAFDVETLYLCYKYGFRIKRIPVKFQGNSISTINLASSSVKMLLDVLSLPIRYHILKSYRVK